MSASKRNRVLPFHNRHHGLRLVAQPKSRPFSVLGANLQPSPSVVPGSTVVSQTGLDTATQASYLSQPFPFLELPGEIRNKVYDLLVPETRVVISGSHPQKELKQMKVREPLKQHKRPHNRLSGKFTGDAVPTALLFACRQMNEEVVELIYARTTFCFDRIVVINKFLNKVPAAGARRIEKLEITHVGYAEPQWTANREWKLRHDAKWSMTLQAIKKEMTGLDRLSLDISVFDWPCRLETSEKWAQPLLQFAEDGLGSVSVKLCHDRFHPAKNASIAKELENMMMTAAGKKQKIQEKKRQAALEKKRKEEAKIKAIKALRITLPLATTTNVNHAPAKKVVKSRGLEQYARAQPPVGYC